MFRFLRVFCLSVLLLAAIDLAADSKKQPQDAGRGEATYFEAP